MILLICYPRRVTTKDVSLVLLSFSTYKYIEKLGSELSNVTKF